MMDVSGSMTDDQKEIVRIEAFWIDTWLKSQYNGVETRYIIHDAAAQKWTRTRSTTRAKAAARGSARPTNVPTRSSTTDFPPTDWNIYCFQFSDGDNWGDDNESCLEISREICCPVSICSATAGRKPLRQRRIHPRRCGRRFGRVSTTWSCPRSTARSDLRFDQGVSGHRESNDGDSRQHVAADRRRSSKWSSSWPCTPTPRCRRSGRAAGRDRGASARVRPRISFRHFRSRRYEELNEIAAYGGFPRAIRTGVRHGVRGAPKGYDYGLQKIYEMVINNDPCYAYLMQSQRARRSEAGDGPRLRPLRFLQEQRLVLPHQPQDDGRDGQPRQPHPPLHGALWRRRGRRRSSTAAWHRGPDRHPFAVHQASRRATALRLRPSREEEDERRRRPVPSKGYMDSYINPPDVLDGRRERIRKQKQRDGKNLSRRAGARRACCSCSSTRRSKTWQRDVLSIVRDEAYYFAPQGQTKIMNEGWASYWHSTIMTRQGLTAAEVDRLRRPSLGHDGHAPDRLNPTSSASSCSATSKTAGTRAGSARSTTSATISRTSAIGTRKLGLGRQKIFEVRRIHNDVTFIDYLPDARILPRAQIVLVRLQPVERLL